MANKKISQLTVAAPLTGTEILPIVQGGVTVQTTAQDIADLGGGGGSPFDALLNPEVVAVNILSATEGTSIPDGVSDSYQKTIPLGFATAPTRVLAVFINGNSFDLQGSGLDPYTYGVTSNAMNTNIPSVQIFDSEGAPRMLVTSDYTQTFRAQQYKNPFTGFRELDESGATIPNGFPKLTYSLSPTLFGVYSVGNRGFGYSSSSAIASQPHSVIKSAYLSGNNLVLLFKKFAATSGETWSTSFLGIQGLNLRVYNLS
jgi:hypothetical protein